MKNRINYKTHLITVCVILALILICLLIMLRFRQNMSDTEIENAKDSYGDISFEPTAALYFDGICPKILVNDKIYYFSMEGEEKDRKPDNYEYYGDISEVSVIFPHSDKQMQATFEATGQIYTNPERPHLIYVFIKSNRTKEWFYRFVSYELAKGNSLMYNGKLFRLNIGESTYKTELPTGFTEVGTLIYCGDDTVPQNEFETNRKTDSYGNYLGNRALYASPFDNGRVYVYEKQYGSDGEFDSYLECELIR